MRKHRGELIGLRQNNVKRTFFINTVVYIRKGTNYIICIIEIKMWPPFAKKLPKHSSVQKRRELTHLEKVRERTNISSVFGLVF